VTARRALAIVAAAVLAVVALRARHPAPPAPGAASASRSAALDETRTTAAPSDGPQAPSAKPGRPRSLRGTRVDGGLAVDADGRFVPGPETRRLFDYFLTATGEEPPERTRSRIVAEIERRLPPSARAEAVALLDRYLDYRERARTFEASGDLPARVEALARLRREIFGDDSRRLFGDERSVARAAEIARIASDATLSEEERVRRLAALDAALPPAASAARARALAPLALANAEAALRAQGGSPEAIRALREQLVGPGAADRLAALDQRRAEWQRRLDDFRAARQAIETDPALDPAERDRRIQDLLAARFTPTERQRVQALGGAAGN